MRRFLLALALVASCLFAAPASAETIKSFDVSAKLTQDRTFTVTETIKYDYEGVDRHGIYRDIPVTYNRNGAKYRFNLDVLDVKRNGKSTTWKTESESGMKRIKIGDPDAYVTGEQTYTIVYSTKKAVNSFPEADELYWNVTGNLWTIDREKASFTLDAPAAGTKTTCFTGIYGSPEKDCTISNPANNPIIFKTTRPLTAGEDFTVVIAFPPGTIRALTFQEQVIDFAKDNIPLMLPVFVFLFMFLIWFIRGRDPRGRGVVITQFDEPHGLRPAEMAYLLDQRLPKRAITATIMDLARRGYLKLVFTGDPSQTGWFKEKVTFTLVCKKERDNELNVFEDEVMCKLFGTSQISPGDEVKLKDVKDFYKAVASIENESIKTLIAKKFFAKNPETVRGLWTFLAFIISMLSFFLIGAFGLWIMLSCFLSSIIIGIFSWYMPKTTHAGAIAREDVEGFKRYLSVSEGERIKFHNAPEKKPELFERYLPAAIAFGVEEAWANQFKDINMEAPSYVSGSTTHWNSLSSYNLAHSFNSVAATSIYPAPSSSGSGGSGFSGGGSGGGGGGGGGGSW